MLLFLKLCGGLHGIMQYDVEKLSNKYMINYMFCSLFGLIKLYFASIWEKLECLNFILEKLPDTGSISCW